MNKYLLCNKKIKWFFKKNKEREINPYIYINKGDKIIQREGIVLSTDDVRELAIHIQKNVVGALPHTIHKN